MGIVLHPVLKMDITLLTKEQIWGDAQGNGQLQVMKDYGTKCGMSDLAVVLGGVTCISDDYKTSDNQQTCAVWSASVTTNGCAYAVHFMGDENYHPANERYCCVRPVISSSVASLIKAGLTTPTKKISGVDIVEYGEYPQTIAPNDIAAELEWELSTSRLKTTGKTYTFDGEKNFSQDKPFKSIEYPEYEHNGKRYVRVGAKPRNNHCVVSNGEKINDGESCWIQVEPVEWLRDQTGTLIARQALIAGLQFHKDKYFDYDFNKTDIKHYLDTYFAKEMQVGRAVDPPATVINPNSVMLSEDRAAQRKRALDNPSQGL